MRLVNTYSLAGFQSQIGLTHNDKLVSHMPSSFTSLLAQTASDHSAAPETLADTLHKHAKQLTDADLEILVAGLREQRTRWNAAQAEGTKKLVKSKQIVTKPAIAAGAGFAIKTPKPIL